MDISKVVPGRIRVRLPVNKMFIEFNTFLEPFSYFKTKSNFIKRYIIFRIAFKTKLQVFNCLIIITPALINVGNIDIQHIQLIRKRNSFIKTFYRKIKLL